MTLHLEDVQGALGEDGAEGGRQAELYQTLQMSHLLCFCFLTGLFQSAAVYQGKASVQMTERNKLKCLDTISLCILIEKILLVMMPYLKIYSGIRLFFSRVRSSF